MNELLEWSEKSALENLKFRLSNSETLAKEASSTLTVLLAGLGGSLAYAVKTFEITPITPFAIGAATLAVWLMLIGFLLVIFCILTTSLPTPTNEPKNIYQPDFTIEELKEAELDNIQIRIEQVTARNLKVSIWLDRVRLLALASPIVFTIVAIFCAAL